MRSYLRCYRCRLYQVFISLLAIVFLMSVCGLLFGGRLKRVSNQLNTYSKADYDYLYVLNYDAPMDNICVYPDSDLSIYLDENQSKRISASVVMKKPNTDYSIRYLEVLNSLRENQIIISANTADKYDLAIGDTVYVEHPNKAGVSSFTIGSITDYEYDYGNPNLVNDIGVAFVDTDLEYIENIRCKYILYSKQSQAEKLSEYPQIIHDIINKSDNEQKVFKQGVSALFFNFIVSIGMIILSRIILFSKSTQIIKRLYLKGVQKKTLVFAATLEKTVFGIIPVCIFDFVMTLFIPMNSLIASCYYLIPLILSCLYVAISTIILSIKLTKGVFK